MSPNSKYLTSCVTCGQATTKHFAKSHEGNCKSCFSGNAERKCPQCNVTPISRHKQQNGYVCESCYRENDPIGYSNEVRGYYD